MGSRAGRTRGEASALPLYDMVFQGSARSSVVSALGSQPSGPGLILG